MIADHKGVRPGLPAVHHAKVKLVTSDDFDDVLRTLARGTRGIFKAGNAHHPGQVGFAYERNAAPVPTISPTSTEAIAAIFNGLPSERNSHSIVPQIQSTGKASRVFLVWALIHVVAGLARVRR